MLLSPLELLMPAVMLILIFLPLIKVIRGKTRRLYHAQQASVMFGAYICAAAHRVGQCDPRDRRHPLSGACRADQEHADLTERK